MTKLLWDGVGQRFYETGVDRGVLYLADGSGVPWNGITSVQEDFSDDGSTSYFLDGVKYLDNDQIGDYAATLKAFTYPDEFLEYEGIAAVDTGIFVDDQPPKLFGLSYRTRIGDDVSGTDLGYKLHVIYNLIAVQDSQSYQSSSNSTTALEFSWKILGLPEKVPGYHPTAHIVVDSRKITPYKLEQFENLLYGTSTSNAQLPALVDLLVYLSNWNIVNIIDNGDGTWTATLPDESLTMIDATTFQLTNVDATYIDTNTYTITSSDVPQGA